MKQSNISLSQVDAFGVQPKFYVNNKEKYKTSWGGSLTILLLGCVVVACWVYGKDMYYREHPSATVSEIPTSMPERFDIKKDSFNFSFGLQGFDKKNYFDESIYHLKLFQLMVNKVKDEDGNVANEFIWRDLEARRCTEEDFQLDRQYFVTNEANFNMYCMNYDLDDVYFEGIWGSDRLSMIVGRVYPCVEGTDSKVECKPEQEVYDTLNDNQFAINYSDQVINPLNYKEPFQAVGRNSYGLASWDTYRVNNFYFQNVFVEDNTGIVFDHITDKQNLQFTYDKEFVKPGQHKDKVFLEFYLRFQSVKETKISRKYLNLAEVLANVGGILKVLTISFSIVSWLVSRQLFNLQLANQIFDFNTREKGDKDEQKDNKNDKNDNFKRQQQNKGIEFKSYMGLLFPFCASRETKKNKKYLNFAVNKLTGRLNLNYMLEKFVEIEKIKMLLLDSDQYKLFDYISKPLIDEQVILNEEKFKMKKAQTKQEDIKAEEEAQNQNQEKSQVFENIMLLENTSQNAKRRNCIRSYKNIRSKQNKNELDYKMLNFINEAVLLKDQKDKIEKEILDLSQSQNNIQNSQIKFNQPNNQSILSLSYINQMQRQSNQQDQNQKVEKDQILEEQNEYIKQSPKKDEQSLVSPPCTYKQELLDTKDIQSQMYAEIQDIQLDMEYVNASKISDLPDPVIGNSARIKTISKNSLNK